MLFPGGYWDRGPLGGHTDEEVEDMPLAQRLAGKGHKSTVRKGPKAARPSGATAPSGGDAAVGEGTAGAGAAVVVEPGHGAGSWDVTGWAPGQQQQQQQAQAPEPGMPWAQQQQQPDAAEAATGMPTWAQGQPAGQLPWGAGVPAAVPTATGSTGTGAGATGSLGTGPAAGMALHQPQQPLQPAQQPHAHGAPSVMLQPGSFGAMMQTLKTGVAEAQETYGIKQAAAAAGQQPPPPSCVVSHDLVTPMATPAAAQGPPATGGWQSVVPATGHLPASLLGSDDRELDVPLAARRTARKTKSSGKRARGPAAAGQQPGGEGPATGWGAGEGSGAGGEGWAQGAAAAAPPQATTGSMRSEGTAVPACVQEPAMLGPPGQQQQHVSGHAWGPEHGNWQQHGGEWQQQPGMPVPVQAAHMQPQPQHQQRQHIMQPAGLTWLSHGYAEAAAAEFGGPGAGCSYDTAGGFLPGDQHVPPAAVPPAQLLHQPQPAPVAQAAQAATASTVQQGLQPAAEHTQQPGPTPQTGDGSVIFIPETEIKQPEASCCVPATQLATLNTQGQGQNLNQQRGTPSHNSPMAPKQLHFPGGATPEAHQQQPPTMGCQDGLDMNHAQQPTTDCVQADAGHGQLHQGQPQGQYGCGFDGRQQQRQVQQQQHANTTAAPHAQWVNQYQVQDTWGPQVPNKANAQGTVMQSSAEWGPPTYAQHPTSHPQQPAAVSGGQQQWQVRADACNSNQQASAGAAYSAPVIVPSGQPAHPHVAGIQQKGREAAQPCEPLPVSAPPAAQQPSNPAAASLNTSALAPEKPEAAPLPRPLPVPSCVQPPQLQQPQAQQQQQRIVVDLVTPSPAAAPAAAPAQHQQQQEEPPSSGPILPLAR